MLCSNGCGRDAGEWADRRRSRKYCGQACQREAIKRYQRESSRRWRRKNPDKVKAINKRRNEHPKYRERQAEYNREWRRENPDKARATDKRKNEHRNGEYRARRREAYKEHVDRQRVWERDEGVCGICGEPADSEDWHLDHIVPLGPGEHSYENVRVAHPKCNIAKGSEDKQVLAEWYGD